MRSGDSRNLPFHRSSFDLVITSSPYLNAIDYLRCSKFSLVWMGHTISELRKIRKESVGSECASQSGELSAELEETLQSMGRVEQLSEKRKKLLSLYVSDMESSIKEVSRVLRTRGRAVYVIGNNQMGEVFVSNSNAVKSIASQVGLSLTSEYSRTLPLNRRYLPPPSAEASGSNLQSRMRTEVVLEFSRT